MNFINLFMQFATWPIIFLIGIFVAIDDYREGKIKNKWIKLGFGLGLIYFVILLSLALLGSFNVLETSWLWQYLGMVILNSVIAFVLAFALWYFKLWAGGDAKLFTLFVFLIPLSFYSNAYFKYWPALGLFINIILPIFVYLVIKMLWYPLGLALNYLRHPNLMKKYYQEYKVKNKIDKNKIKAYLSAGASFLIILIFFQLLRSRLGAFLSPYLGNLLIAAYFFMGFVLFKPLRTLLQKRVVVVLVLSGLYIIAGIIYFPQIVLADLHKLFALQLIFMLSFFYIFKFAQIAGQFIYNSAEVKVIPLSALAAGVYINKDYIRKIMGDRTNIDSFQKEIADKLEADDKASLEQLIKIKTDKTRRAKKQYQWASFWQYLYPEAWSDLIGQVWQYRKQKQSEAAILTKISGKLTAAQKQTLDNILNNSDEVKKFLKSLTGRLTAEQAQNLKAMLEARNQEAKAAGSEPIDKIILHKTFSFAPFMFFGVLITLVTKSSLIHLIYQYILHK